VTVRPPAAIYVHLPFCPYICPYCDFAKWAYDGAAAERYLEALAAEIAAAPDVRGTTLFFGGGTPNTYAPERIAALVAALTERFEIPAGAEISLEANPDPALTMRLDVLRAAGVNRLSFGVQSFEAAELRALGRGHDADDVRRAVERARAAGFTNVSIDLMFGTPHQTEASWARSLDAAIALEVEHVSTYGLTIEEGTPYARWHAREPGAFADDTLEARLYALAIDRLGAAGYEHYEISNFARAGFRCAHNAVYWRNGVYLGLGVGAASYLDGVRSTHTRDRAAYEAAARAGAPIPGSAERLEGDAAAGEAIMLALRTSEGVDARVFRETYGIDVFDRYAPAVADFTAAGLLAADERGFRLTVRGRFVANDVCAAFL
jgi:oxygen-independent coproporphyrinogen-3 oxidase